MRSWRNVSRQCWAACLAVVVLSSVGIAAEPSWVSFTPAGGLAVEPVDREAAPVLTITASDLKTLSLEIQWNGLTVSPTKGGQSEFVEITWPDAAFAGEVGEPNLPVLRRLFVAPEGASITATVQAGVPAVLDLAAAGFPSRIKPEQPPVEKVPGALQAAPFVVNEAVYAQNTDLLPVRAEVTELGIVRGYRLCLLEVRPVTYNPARGLLTWWPELSVKLDFAGGSRSAVERSPLGLHRVVLNPELLAATRASGNYLIVTGTNFEAEIAGFAAAKAAQGFTVSTHAVAPGTANTTIKAHIQSLYADPLSAPDYVLLVGDTETIPHWVGQGEGSPATDIQYGCMDGASDYYPDIAVGRFPVDNVTELQTMVSKTLYYENGPLADPDYLKRAVFMASTDNYQITEGTHNYVINTHLAPNEYICDKLYTVTYDATTQDVRNSFNAGRFYGVYSGHGGTNSWGDGPPFSESDVNGLTNANMYAMILSFSCITGTYTVDQCFMETWVLTPNTGAVTAWGSSVNSYWTEDDILEKRLFDAIFDAEDDVASEIGPIFNETKMRFLAHFGNDSTTRRYFEMYNLMGDPALALPGTCSDTGTVQLNRGRYACEDTVTVRVSDCGLNLDDNVVETVTVAVNSDSENGVESLVLSETSANSATFEGMIDLSTTNAPGVLLVADGDVVWATYIDADDGQGGINVPVNASATVDCTAPVISGVQVTGVEPRSATVSINADEPIRGSVRYGLSCAGLTGSAGGSGFANPATVSVTGLQDNTTYFFAVEATDEAGNSASDDNGGACYSFTTPEIPDFFTELFASNNDLDNLTLTFTPNGSNDFYAGCVEAITELPVDPAGGTPLTLSDDSYATVSLAGGTQVSLYGVSYSTFYPGSNGYITFTAGDNARNEALADHFDLPRISAVFDDFDPDDQGLVSWKQLADRVVVTWEDLPEYNTSNSNTFQIEMHFDGTIVISYLGIAASDGLAGLSAGNGVDPDYYPSDLSAMGACGPKPPMAQSASYETGMGQEFEIVLSATDDGLPDPPAALTYVITQLPTRGGLFDPGTDQAIAAVPYVLVNGGATVVYRPSWGTSGQDSFRFKANDGGEAPDGGDSNEATVSVMINAAPPGVVYSWPLDVNPGWSVEGQWAFGTPKGGGTHNKDPQAAYTGSYVYGYNLYGDYANNLSLRCLTTTAIDCTRVSQAQLRFWRWLGVEAFDSATVEVSADGQNWSTVWSNQTEGVVIVDMAWTPVTLNLSAVADGSSMVFVRWGMGPTDGYTTYPGWNIDDVEIWGVESPAFGDHDGDGDVDLEDFASMPGCLTGPEAGAVEIGCEAFDFDVDTDVDLSDFAAFQEAMSQ